MDRSDVNNLQIINEFGEIHFLESIDISEDFENLYRIFNVKQNEISINNDICKNPNAFNRPARLIFKNFCRDHYLKYEQKRKLSPQELNQKIQGIVDNFIKENNLEIDEAENTFNLENKNFTLTVIS